MEFIPWFLGVFSNCGGQFKGNCSNLRLVKLHDLTMGTICVIALSLICYIIFEIEFLYGFDPGKFMINMGKIWEKSWKSHRIHEQNPCMNPGMCVLMRACVC